MAKIKRDLGQGGAHLNTDLLPLFEAALTDLTALKGQIDDLQAKYNAHIADTASHTVADATNQATGDVTLTLTE